jgi:perosamine synthetase
MKSNLLLHPSATAVAPGISVPFFSPDIGEAEINEVVSTLRSGWLTTGPQVKKFEQDFAKAVHAKYAVAVNSCTAALHLAVEAIGLCDGQAVLVPTMTFAATAEIVLYKNAIPILVDCDPVTGNMDLDDAERKIEKLKSGRLPYFNGRQIDIVGIIPVHVGGYMLDIQKVREFAERHDLWVIEDAAHAFPASWRSGEDDEWLRCGEGTALVTCFSFYANKTITTGEGGMAVTNDKRIADRIRLMSLHGLSHDAWGRFSGGGSWDYRIVQPGYKYNMTDVAAAMGRHQLARAEEMRTRREEIADFYLRSLDSVEEIGLPSRDADRIHSWHLFAIRLRLSSVAIDRNEFIEELRQFGVGSSVHWRPLHLHPLYLERFGWEEHDFPAATDLWHRTISLPIFSSMKLEEMKHVVYAVKKICSAHAAGRISMVA